MSSGPARAIIKKFGGMSALARALGHKHGSTVQGWKDGGFIPAWRQREVLDAAIGLGIDLDPAEFIGRDLPGAVVTDFGHIDAWVAA